MGNPCRLDERLWFPDPREAVSIGPAAGLIAVGGDLSVERLLLAYSSGIFPWSVEPITWWSPDPRGIFEIGQLHLGRSLQRTLRRAPFQITVDRAFREVITACAAVERAGSWITPAFIEAYTRLHKAGHAHSVECWKDGVLVGGIYGVAIGGLFAGESMFHTASDASKVALCHLMDRLMGQGYRLFDIQMVTETTRRLGAVSIPREEYLNRLADAVARPVAFD
ncbi:MAG TPA: leucyl/phenylalanyl-tRNA--protein transferase [Roseimicrobium sp.]|nr:leucyl/phenylalanyl-tRNA--protein transferase [Roseimicrobium sp.]